MSGCFTSMSRSSPWPVAARSTLSRASSIGRRRRSPSFGRVIAFPLRGGERRRTHQLERERRARTLHVEAESSAGLVQSSHGFGLPLTLGRHSLGSCCGLNLPRSVSRASREAIGGRRLAMGGRVLRRPEGPARPQPTHSRLGSHRPLKRPAEAGSGRPHPRVRRTRADRFPRRNRERIS
jgi:hypothetical protein